MPDALPARFIIAFVIVLALIALTAWLFRRFSGQAGIQAWGKGHDHRIEVLDAVAVDPKRRLLLVRCDEEEHLILVGGGTDIVVSGQSNIAHVSEQRAPKADGHQQQLRAQEAQQIRAHGTDDRQAPARDPRFEPTQPQQQQYSPAPNGRAAPLAEAQAPDRSMPPAFAQPQQYQPVHPQTPQAQAPQAEQRPRAPQRPQPSRPEDIVRQAPPPGYAAQAPREVMPQAHEAPEVVRQAPPPPTQPRQLTQPEARQPAPDIAREKPQAANEPYEFEPDLDLADALARSLEETMPSPEQDNVQPLKQPAARAPQEAVARKVPEPAAVPAEPKTQASAPPPQAQPEPQPEPKPEPEPAPKNPVYDDMAKRLEAALKPLDTTFDSAQPDKKAKN